MSVNKSAPTMKDVAREAGVALGTVSKVVNGIPVGEEYRVRVEAAIEKLNYRINNYAKGLKSNKTMVVAVIMPNLVSPYFCMLVRCINKALNDRSYRMVYYSSDYVPELEAEWIRTAEQQKVDGIICLSYNPKQIVPENLPLVSIDRYFGGKIPCVASDNYGGGWMAAEKLSELGCKNVAILQIGSRLPTSRTSGATAFWRPARHWVLPVSPASCTTAIPIKISSTSCTAITTTESWTSTACSV